MNLNISKGEELLAPSAAELKSPADAATFGAPSAGMSRRGLFWMAICATVGSLYFMGISAGYLMFAGVLPEARLGFVYAGIFVTLLLLRLIGLRMGAAPTRHSVMTYSLYGVVVLLQLLWYKPIADSGGHEQYLTVIGDSIVASGLLAITGEAFGVLWSNGRAGAVYRRTMVAYGACIGTIALGVLMGWDKTAEMRLLFQNEMSTGLYTYNYLTLGDSIALLGLLMLGQSRRFPVRLVVLFCTAVALFFAYSRTSFFLFCVCSPFIFLIGAKDAQKIGMAAAFFVMITLVIAVVSESEALRPAMERMAILVTDREQDDSFQARRELMSENLGHLSENWVFGRFLDQWFRYGETAGYIHNWLSFWQYYGILPFVASLALFGTLARRLWLDLRNPTFITGGALALFAYGMLAIVSSRAFGWAYLWLVLGTVSSLRTSRGPGSNRS